MTPEALRWAEIAEACALLVVDPGLKGAVLRGPGGPARDVWIETLKSLVPAGSPWRRMPASIDDERLIGGIDLAAALAGCRVLQRGLLAEAHEGVLIAPQVERLSAGATARLCAVLDRGEVTVARDGLDAVMPAAFALIAFDEAAPDEGRCADPLRERLALDLDLTGLDRTAERPDDGRGRRRGGEGAAGECQLRRGGHRRPLRGGGGAGRGFTEGAAVRRAAGAGGRGAAGAGSGGRG
jgi:magnesium chelatase subunit D